MEGRRRRTRLSSLPDSTWLHKSVASLPPQLKQYSHHHTYPLTDKGKSYKARFRPLFEHGYPAPETMRNNKDSFRLPAIKGRLDQMIKPCGPVRRRARRLYYHPKFRKLEGYHFGITLCAMLSAAVLIVNYALTIWAYKNYEVIDGIVTIKEGNCDQMKSLATKLHLGINILSSLLLGSSNYSRQCLSAPTRHDIDECHKQRVWLSVGTSSLRNLIRIPRQRAMLWLLIAFSSVPLHLLYNSAVFTTLYAREYKAFLVTHSFLAGGSSEITSNAWDQVYGVFSAASPGPDVETLQGRALYLRDQQHSLSQLANIDCLRTYSTSSTSILGDVLVVLQERYDHEFPSPFLAVWPSIKPEILFASQTSREIPWYCSDDSVLQGGNCSLNLAYSFAWNCKNHTISDIGPDNECNTHDLVAQADHWRMFGRQVEHCLREPVEEHCRIQLSSQFMVVVIICNICKMYLMGYVAWKKPGEPLVTVGDAVASFLDNPDLTTKGNCLLEKTHFERTKSDNRTGRQRCLPNPRDLEAWKSAANNADLRIPFTNADLGSPREFTGYSCTRQQQNHGYHHNHSAVQHCSVANPWKGRPRSYTYRRPRWFAASTLNRRVISAIQ